jgi:hypothetical protein
MIDEKWIRNILAQICAYLKYKYLQRVEFYFTGNHSVEHYRNFFYLAIYIYWIRKNIILCYNIKIIDTIINIVYIMLQFISFTISFIIVFVYLY